MDIDVKIFDQGSVAGFSPISAAAREWFAANVDAPAYACAGRFLVWADHRPAQDIVNGLEAEGFVLGGAL